MGNCETSWFHTALLTEDVFHFVGVVTTLAGAANSYADGVGSAASFSKPTGICVSPSGDLVVSDNANNLIRKVSTSGKDCLEGLSQAIALLSVCAIRLLVTLVG